MSTQEAKLTAPTNKSPTDKSKGQLSLPKTNRSTAALSGLIDSVLHKLGSFQSDSGLGCLSIGVVSCAKRAGVSTVTHRLAVQAALNGENNVLIVDANSVRPNQHRLSGVAAGPGLIDHLANGNELASCIQPSSIRHLDILTWGSFQNPGFSVTPAELKELFADLRSRYQYIFIDIPSMDEDSRTVQVFYAMMADGVVIVLDGVESKESPTKELVDFFEEHGVKVLGAIMNKYAPAVPRWLRRWF